MPLCSSLFSGFDKNVCQLMPDPMDSECCKIAVCDLTGFETDRIREATTGKAEVRSLILDSVEAYNATAARIRVYLTPSNETRSRKVLFQAFFAKIDSPASFDESEKIVAKWNSVKLEQERNNLKGPHVVSALRHAYDFEIDALEPATEYFIKIHELNANVTSNTVVVRTFPPGIDASFSGCFHGNKTYEAGQVFFDGCAYKCTCRDGGLRECEERCPVYIDTIGYENCEWQAAPDDPCCTIPVCSNQTTTASPASEHKVLPAVHDSIPQPTIESVEPFCVSSSNDVYTVGQSWSEGTSCLPKSCECLLHPNGSTVTECKGGCATIPDTAFRPTIECPKPELITPEDACLCPYVVCNHPRNTIIPPPRLPNASHNIGLQQRQPLSPIEGKEHPHSSSPRPAASHPALVSSDPKGCPFKGKTIPFGHEVYDGCRAVCHCGPDGEMNCGLIDCPHHFGSRVSECAEWEIDPEFELAPPNCCPKMKCKPSGSCMFAGLPVENFKAIPSDMLPCGTKCVCLNGNITCESHRCPALSDIPPRSLPCPDHMKFKGHAKGETCCLQWMCRDRETAGKSSCSAF